MSEPRLFLDPYGEWAAREGIPVVNGFGVDLLALDVQAGAPRRDAREVTQADARRQ